MTGRRSIAAAASVLALTLFAAPSAADDHRPPRSRLNANGTLQWGRTVESSWVQGPRTGCPHAISEYVFGFPEPIITPVGEVPATLRLRKRQRPDGLSIRSWTQLGEHGFPEGPATPVPYRMHPSKRDGRTVAWLAGIRPVVTDHLYIAVTARWRDVDCNGGRQQMGWTFHLASSTSS